MKWFQWPVNIGQNLLHITVDAYLDLIYCSWENWLQTGLLSFWCDFAGGTCDLFLSQRQFIVHHCWLVWGTKTAFWQYCDVLGTRFGDCPRRCRVNWLPGGTECEIGASYGRIAVRVTSFSVVILLCCVHHAAATKTTVRSGAPASWDQARRLRLLLQSFWRSFYWLRVRFLCYILHLHDK